MPSYHARDAAATHRCLCGCGRLPRAISRILNVLGINGVVTYTDCSHGLRTQRLKTSPAWPTSNRLRQIERFAFEEIHIVPEELDRKRGRSSQGTYAFSGVLNMLKWDAGSVKACIPVFVRHSLTAGWPEPPPASRCLLFSSGGMPWMVSTWLS